MSLAGTWWENVIGVVICVVLGGGFSWIWHDKFLIREMRLERVDRIIWGLRDGSEMRRAEGIC
jgi:hypothetical protein